MKKAAMILIGGLLFFAGILTGNLIDNNQASAVGYTIEYGNLVTPPGWNRVEWKGSIVKVWCGVGKRFPARFIREVKGGKVELYGLDPR